MNIWLLSKLSHVIHLFKFVYKNVRIMGHLQITSDPMDLNGNTRNI